MGLFQHRWTGVCALLGALLLGCEDSGSTIDSVPHRELHGTPSDSYVPLEGGAGAPARSSGAEASTDALNNGSIAPNAVPSAPDSSMNEPGDSGHGTGGVTAGGASGGAKPMKPQPPLVQLDIATAEVLTDPANWGLPHHVIPVDVHPEDGRFLLSSHELGLFEFDPNTAGSGRLNHLTPEPAGQYGHAIYVEGGVWAALLSKGIQWISATGSKVLTPEDGLAGRSVHRLLGRPNGDLWINIHGTPVSTGAYQIFDGTQFTRSVVAEGPSATVSSWMNLPGRDTVIALTPTATFELHPDLKLSKLSDSARSISLGRKDGELGIVGGGFLRWDGTRFEPVAFLIQGEPDQEIPRGITSLSLSILDDGTWLILGDGGILLAVDIKQQITTRVWTQADGIPADASELLWSPRRRSVMIGGSQRPALLVFPE